ncbi:hypothetical protein [Haladaptatus sp. DJG-WS-42]|uniref:hypothetical protein n=1 Tax=Haladaptatus sp. DJG-WS-42 TaxID=3120516 RepID=UPI0030D39BAB
MTTQILQHPAELELHGRDNPRPEPAPVEQQPPKPELPPIELEDGRTISVPDNATDAEMAAIAAAVSAHLSAEDTARTEAEQPTSESNWSVARRLTVGREARRLPHAASGDAWKLAGRLH